MNSTEKLALDDGFFFLSNLNRDKLDHTYIDYLDNTKKLIMSVK